MYPLLPLAVVILGGLVICGLALYTAVKAVEASDRREAEWREKHARHL